MSALSVWAEELQGKTAEQAYVYHKQKASQNRRTQKSINQMVVNALRNVDMQFKPQQNDEIGKALASAVGSQLQKEMQKAINIMSK